MAYNMTEVQPKVYDALMIEAKQVKGAFELHPHLVEDLGYAEICRGEGGKQMGCVMDNGLCFVDKSLLVD